MGGRDVGAGAAPALTDSNVDIAPAAPPCQHLTPNKGNDGNIHSLYHSCYFFGQVPLWWRVQLKRSVVNPSITFRARDYYTDSFGHKLDFYIGDSTGLASA